MNILRGKIDKDKPVLLITDGHSSRGHLDARMLWENHKVMILVLPPHSSALLQPLDLSLNGEFKRVFSEYIDLTNYISKAEKRQKVMETALLSLTKVNNNMMCTILDGWRKTGLMPMNIHSVLSSTMVRDIPKLNIEYGQRIPRRRGLKFVGGTVIYDGISQ